MVIKTKRYKPLIVKNEIFIEMAAIFDNRKWINSRLPPCLNLKILLQTMHLCQISCLCQVIERFLSKVKLQFTVKISMQIQAFTVILKRLILLHSSKLTGIKPFRAIEYFSTIIKTVSHITDSKMVRLYIKVLSF